jgi:thiol-disulfide isomerase/thioredoxin
MHFWFGTHACCFLRRKYERDSDDSQLFIGTWNFWASWFPPCKGKIPHFNDAYSKYKENVVFMMVDMVDSQKEMQDKGQKYVEGQGYSFPSSLITTSRYLKPIILCTFLRKILSIQMEKSSRNIKELSIKRRLSQAYI